MVIPWIQEVSSERILGSIGHVPGKQLRTIAAKLADLKDQE